MYQNYKVIVNTAAGRRRYMQYLIPQVLSCDIVDRYDLWLNTTNKQDLEFFRVVAEKYPKINLVWQPDGIVDGNASINAFYRMCIDEDSLYFKLDDDIVWMEDGLIEKMVKFRVDNPTHFLVSPLVINNSLSTYLLQVYGKIKFDRYYRSDCSCKVLWGSGKFAADLHYWFIDNYLKTGQVSNLYLGGGIPMGVTRFSINSVIWFGKDMKSIDGIVSGDDEEFLSCICPALMKKSNCWNGDAIIAHFAFYSQREYLDKRSVLEQYGEYLVSKWRSDTRLYEIYHTIKDAMNFVEQNKANLPEAPYRQIIRKQERGSMKNIKWILPYNIVEGIYDSRRERQEYIRE